MGWEKQLYHTNYLPSDSANGFTKLGAACAVLGQSPQYTNFDQSPGRALQRPFPARPIPAGPPNRQITSMADKLGLSRSSDWLVPPIAGFHSFVRRHNPRGRSTMLYAVASSALHISDEEKTGGFTCSMPGSSQNWSHANTRLDEQRLLGRSVHMVYECS